MQLKQFRWKTVPSARTNAPCMGFPHAEHILWELMLDDSSRGWTSTHDDATLVAAVDEAVTLVLLADEKEDSEVTLSRRPERSECPDDEP